MRKTLEELRASGRPPKIFTSEQIHEATNETVLKMMREYPDLQQVALIGLTHSRIMIALGLSTPEDFYE